MLHIVLVEPEIPQNCGNVARTCAATGSQLHLIRPLGFDISEKAVRRAGLDYWNLVEVFDYENLEDFFRRRPEAERDLWLTTTKAPRSYQEARFTADSWLFFGKETAGLPLALRERYRDRCVRLPMVSEARSLNLSNTVAVCVYEALRQNGFPGPAGNRRDGLGLSPAGRRRFRWGGPAAFTGRGAALHCRGAAGGEFPSFGPY